MKTIDECTELELIEALIKKMYRIPADVSVFNHVLFDIRRIIKKNFSFPILMRDRN